MNERDECVGHRREGHAEEDKLGERVTASGAEVDV